MQSQAKACAQDWVGMGPLLMCIPPSTNALSIWCAVLKSWARLHDTGRGWTVQIGAKVT